MENGQNHRLCMPAPRFFQFNFFEILCYKLEIPFPIRQLGLIKSNKLK